MTSLHNTTDTKDMLIREILKVIIPPDTPEVWEIKIRNKQDEIIHGNWGYFYPTDYRITLNVPQWKKGMVLEGKRRYSLIEYRFDNNLDFLANVIGHEYYHAWQWHHEKDLWHAKQYLEVQAEKYEVIALNKWKDHLNQLGIYDAVASRG